VVPEIVIVSAIMILDEHETGKQVRSSFLKKRSKKLLAVGLSLSSGVRHRSKVFWFFFSKKNCLPYFLWAAT
jgi:hypothetical protein